MEVDLGSNARGWECRRQDDAFEREYADDHSWEMLQEDDKGRLLPLVGGLAGAKLPLLLPCTAWQGGDGSPPTSPPSDLLPEHHRCRQGPGASTMAALPGARSS
jgi:hypothetical protein